MRMLDNEEDALEELDSSDDDLGMESESDAELDCSYTESRDPSQGNIHVVTSAMAVQEYCF